MTYTGKVTVGGPPDLRDLPGLSVAKLAVGPMDNNAYLLTCTITGTAVLIDAASEAGRLIELIGSTPVTRTVRYASVCGGPGPRTGAEEPTDGWERSRRATRSTGFRGIPARSFRN